MTRLLAAFILFGLINSLEGNKLSKKVLLISMDGFRWDYLNTIPDLPNLKKMAENGVRLQYVNNTFITTTFPTHYSMATGLWEENHGIVGNKMYDPEFNETFAYGPNIAKWWDGGEPIWITATKQKLNVGTYFWPGSEVELDGLRPMFWKSYDKSIPFMSRVTTVVSWFKDHKIDFSTLYFYEPDGTGHEYGPYSEDVKAKVREMDEILGNLMTKMRDAGVLENLNIILTSDHGMAEVNSTTKVIFLYDYVNAADIERLPGTGAIAQIFPAKGKEDIVYQALVKAHPNMTVYKKEDIPDHFHFKHHVRIMPIVAIASEGWLILSSRRSFTLRGQHGYDNRLLDMRPIFLAQGPNFKVNYTAHSINSVDIYPLVCKLLDINPAPHNGTFDNVQNLLRITDSVSNISGKKILSLSGVLLMAMTYIYHILLTV